MRKLIRKEILKILIEEAIRTKIRRVIQTQKLETYNRNKKEYIIEQIILNEINFTQLENIFKQKLIDKFGNTDALEAAKKATPQNATYAQWILKHVLWGNILPEDIYKYEEYFKIFDRRKRSYSNTDIFSFGYHSGDKVGSKKGVRDFLKQTLDIKNQEKQDPSAAAGLSKNDKYAEFKIGEVAGFTVYELPKGRKDLYGVSCELGSGTEWCTATGKTRTHFDHYIKDESLFIFIRGKEKYQIGLRSDQFKDNDDEEVVVL